MKRLIHDQNGKPSTMRLAVLMSTVTGCSAVIAAGVALFVGIPEAVQFGALGVAMASVGELAKAQQAKGGN